MRVGETSGVGVQVAVPFALDLDGEVRGGVRAGGEAGNQLFLGRCKLGWRLYGGRGGHLLAERGRRRDAVMGGGLESGDLGGKMFKRGVYAGLQGRRGGELRCLGRLNGRELVCKGCDSTAQVTYHANKLGN